MSFHASNHGMTVVWDVPSSRHRTRSDASATSYTTASTRCSETSSSAGGMGFPGQALTTYSVTVRNVTLTQWPLMKLKHSYYLVVKYYRGKSAKGTVGTFLLPHQPHSTTHPLRTNINASFTFECILKRTSSGDPIPKKLSFKFVFEEWRTDGCVNRTHDVGEPSLDIWEAFEGGMVSRSLRTITFRGGSVALTFTKEEKVMAPPPAAPETIMPSVAAPPIALALPAPPERASLSEDATPTAHMTPELTPHAGPGDVAMYIRDVCNAAGPDWTVSRLDEFMMSDCVKVITAPNDATPLWCFHVLFGDASKYLLDCHTQRKDIGFNSVAWHCPTPWGAFRTALCDAKIAGDRYPCRQRHVAVYCANPTPRVVVLTSAVAETVAMGKSVRLEMMFDFTEGFLTMRGHVHYESSMVRAMVGGKLAAQVVKSLGIMERNAVRMLTPTEVVPRPVRTTTKGVRQSPRLTRRETRRMTGRSPRGPLQGSFKSTISSPWVQLEGSTTYDALTVTRLLQQIGTDQKRSTAFAVPPLDQRHIDTLLRVLHVHHAMPSVVAAVFEILEIACIGHENRRRVAWTPHFVTTINVLVPADAPRRRQILANLEEQREGAHRMTHTDEDVIHRHECQSGLGMVWRRVAVSLTRHWVIVEGSGMQWACHYLDVTQLSDSVVWGMYPAVTVMCSVAPGSVTFSFKTKAARNAMLSDISQLRTACESER